MNKTARSTLVANWCAGRGLPCFWCQRDFGKGSNMATIDHFIPIGRRGEDAPCNAVVAHQQCNSVRAHRFPNETEMRRFVALKGLAGREMLARYAGVLERALRS